MIISPYSLLKFIVMQSNHRFFWGFNIGLLGYKQVKEHQQKDLNKHRAKCCARPCCTDYSLNQASHTLAGYRPLWALFPFTNFRFSLQGGMFHPHWLRHRGRGISMSVCEGLFCKDQALQPSKKQARQTKAPFFLMSEYPVYTKPNNDLRNVFFMVWEFYCLSGLLLHS